MMLVRRIGGSGAGHGKSQCSIRWKPWVHTKRSSYMAAMKPRTGDGPMEVAKEGRSLIMRVPLEGGGRLVVELKADEAAELRQCLESVTA